MTRKVQDLGAKVEESLAQVLCPHCGLLVKDKPVPNFCHWEFLFDLARLLAKPEARRVRRIRCKEQNCDHPVLHPLTCLLGKLATKDRLLLAVVVDAEHRHTPSGDYNRPTYNPEPEGLACEKNDNITNRRSERYKRYNNGWDIKTFWILEFDDSETRSLAGWLADVFTQTVEIDIEGF